MFGRRNPDQPLDPQQPPQQPESDLDLDMLDDLPDIPAREEPRARQAEEPPLTDLPPDPAWHSATPSILGPSVTRLLQEAEAAHQRPAEPPSSASSGQGAAPSSAVTQQLSPVPPAQPPLVPSMQPTPINGAPAQVAARPRTIAESVIGPDDFFDGRYRSERGVRIQGNARGSIESRQYIFVEAGAQVEADLSAEDITVSGDFKGKIICRRKLEVTNTGKIAGQVQTALLVVQEGGALDGELHMRDQELAGDADTRVG
jgi:cytoskeletal protein CcmA (bactofilin family)